jgi:hypothetical protein
METLFITIIGCLFVFTSIFDALKYRWNASKIRQYKSSKGHSRKFINVAIFNDIVRLTYGFLIHDSYIVLSSLLAMIFMSELFFMIYWYYPYKYRNLRNFKRPNIFLYLLNSILPNRIARRL